MIMKTLCLGFGVWYAYMPDMLLCYEADILDPEIINAIKRKMDSWNTEFREVFAVAYPFLKETFLPESGNVAYGEKTTTEIAEDILEKIRADESRVANVFQTKKEVTRGLVGEIRIG